MASPASAATPFSPCLQDKPRLALRSQELQAIVQADQAERSQWDKKTADEIVDVAKRDEDRRKRVGEIFGEGCFSSPADYAAAALVFQHGETPDHFLQTYLWAKRAVDLGDVTQKRLMALGIDRYLVHSGHKQLFGSQATKPELKAESCWCLQAVEKRFPDRLRREIAGKSYAEAAGWLKELNAGKACPNKECSAALKPSPRGTVPGFW